MTRGCLAARACASSRTQAKCSLRIPAAFGGRLEANSASQIWEQSELFATLRDTGRLEGKCSPCEFKQVCMGCRARAYGMTGNYLAEEPFCFISRGPSGKPHGRKPRVKSGRART
jgi:radical SAM protein with 4Fe4S-binding SPASM domain